MLHARISDNMIFSGTKKKRLTDVKYCQEIFLNEIRKYSGLVYVDPSLSRLNSRNCFGERGTSIVASGYVTVVYSCPGKCILKGTKHMEGVKIIYDGCIMFSIV